MASKRPPEKPKATPTAKPAPAVPPAPAASAARPPAPRLGGAPLAPVRGGGKTPELDLSAPEGEEHRKFPRARLGVRFECRIGEKPDLKFSASLTSRNLSVSGAFLESSFFLPIGTELRVSFVLEDSAEPVEARAQIAREERPDPRTAGGRSGFAIRFVEFFGQTEVTLARLFLGEQLRAFAGDYLGSRRAKSLTSELDRVVDALAAWELMKVTQPGDPWVPVKRA